MLVRIAYLRVGSKTIENEPPLVLKLMNFTSLNDAHIHNYSLCRNKS